MAEIIFPQKSEILELQAELIKVFDGIHGIRDEGGFESALSAAEIGIIMKQMTSLNLPQHTAIISLKLTHFSTEIKGSRQRLPVFF